MLILKYSSITKQDTVISTCITNINIKDYFWKTLDHLQHKYPHIKLICSSVIMKHFLKMTAILQTTLLV